MTHWNGWRRLPPMRPARSSDRRVLATFRSNPVQRPAAPAIAVQAILKRSAERQLATSRSNTPPASSRS